MAPAKAQPTSLTHERELASAYGARFVAGVDEVGRGALAGPISVGVTVIDLQQVTEFPELRDSKLLSVARREELVPEVHHWAVSYGVGHASAALVDELGVTAALRLAGTRAIASCTVAPEVVLLDGSYDWLTAPEQNLFDLLAEEQEPTGLHIPVRTIIKGDMTCQSIAGASILAKVERDDLMSQAATEYPAFGWEINKGYATATHRAAIEQFGPCQLHRQSWNLTSKPQKAEGKA